jgi:hypothetical protein
VAGPSAVMAGVSDTDFTLSASDFVNGLSAARIRIIGDTTWTPGWTVYIPTRNTVRTVLPWSYLYVGTLTALSPTVPIYTVPGNYTLLIETINTLSVGMTGSINFTVNPTTPYGSGIVYRTYQV